MVLFAKDMWNWVEDRRIDHYVFTNAHGYREYYMSLYGQSISVPKKLERHFKVMNIVMRILIVTICVLSIFLMMNVTWMR